MYLPLVNKHYIIMKHTKQKSCLLTLYPLFHLSLQPVEVVSRFRDPQFQVGENCS